MVSRVDALARWAYSEILDGLSARYYNDQPGIVALRAKHRSGVPFSALAANDRQLLAFNCALVRGTLFDFLSGAEQFHEQRLTKSEIAPFLVPWNVAGLPPMTMMRFDAYIDMPSTGPDDPRSEHRAYTHVPDDPLTVGRVNDDYVLVDGYHRVVSFWRTAPVGAFILAYMPVSDR